MTVPLTEAEISKARKNDWIGTRLVAETDGMRIWHLRIAPGETLPAHRHDRPYFWTVLCDGKPKAYARHTPETPPKMRNLRKSRLQKPFR